MRLCKKAILPILTLIAVLSHRPCGADPVQVAASYFPNWGSPTESARTEWFREAKFGMFITWGLYSVPAGTWKGKELKHAYGEWIEWALPIPHEEYAGIAETWEPKQFDADAWVRIAKDAGMKYLLITAKFCDGFLMYPSKITPYNIHDRTPFGEELGSCDADGKASTDPKRFIEKKDWRCTTQPGKIYFHLFKWPGCTFETPPVASKVKAAYLLSDRRPLSFKQTDKHVTVTLPEGAPKLSSRVLCLETGAGYADTQ